MHNNRINSDWQFRCAPLPAGYVERYAISAFGLGSELWCKHSVNVYFQTTENENTRVNWNINLKLFGLQTGKNAIIEECKEIINKIA